MNSTWNHFQSPWGGHGPESSGQTSDGWTDAIQKHHRHFDQVCQAAIPLSVLALPSVPPLCSPLPHLCVHLCLTIVLTSVPPLGSPLSHHCAHFCPTLVLTHVPPLCSPMSHLCAHPYPTFAHLCPTFVLTYVCPTFVLTCVPSLQLLLCSSPFCHSIMCLPLHFFYTFIYSTILIYILLYKFLWSFADVNIKEANPCVHVNVHLFFVLCMPCNLFLVFSHLFCVLTSVSPSVDVFTPVSSVWIVFMSVSQCILYLKRLATCLWAD